MNFSRIDLHCVREHPDQAQHVTSSTPPGPVFAIKGPIFRRCENADHYTQGFFFYLVHSMAIAQRDKETQVSHTSDFTNELTEPGF